MKARPVLFSAPMVRALLAGTKTQTRRLVKPQPAGDWSPEVGTYHPTKIDGYGEECPGDAVFGASDEYEGRPCPYGQPGDLLWVRETWSQVESRSGEKTSIYSADGWKDPEQMFRWTPSIHMPRRASRLTLRITDVRVQRLQEISSDDARAEGVEWDAKGWHDYLHAERRKSSAGQSFETLWQSINGADSWAANPWVWAFGFEVLHTNIDQVLAAKQAA